MRNSKYQKIRARSFRRGSDELTGHYYLDAMYCSTNDITFLTQDSYKGEQDNYSTWNLYSYCAGNPINHIDIWGNKNEGGKCLGKNETHVLNVIIQMVHGL
ncbi:MAG: hypothetical protein ACLRZ9_07180 [Eubacterium sp.]